MSATVWTPELWLPDVGWRPRPLPRFSRRAWRKAKEEALTEAVAFGNANGAIGSISGTTWSQTLTTPTVGDLVVMIVENASFTAGTMTPTNNAGQSWQTIIPSTTDAFGVSWAVFATKLGASPSGTCAGTDTRSANHTVAVLRFTGTDNIGIGDGFSVQSSLNTSVTTQPSGPINTSNTNDILIGWSSFARGATITWTGPGAPWNLGISLGSGTGTTTWLMWVGYQIVTSAQSGVSFPGATNSGGTAPDTVGGIVALVGLTDPPRPPRRRTSPVSFASALAGTR